MAPGESVSVPEFGTKQAGIDYIDRPGVYAVIENNDRQIAVIETSNGYFLPGGGIHIGESDVDALNREVMEETGYQVAIRSKIGEAVEYIDSKGEGKHYQIHCRFYSVQLRSKVRDGIEKDHRLVWLLLEDAVRLLKRQGQAWIIQRVGEEYGN
jgi:8-oxo-dGTP diphosphatase